jgi:hypothetical protein
MNSLTDSVYRFGASFIETSSGEISQAEIYPNRHFNPLDIGNGRALRVWDMVGGKPIYNEIQSVVVYYNAQVPLEFVVKADSLAPEDKEAARLICSAMAQEFIIEMDKPENGQLGSTDGTICDVQIIRQDDDWRAFGDVIHPVTYLVLQFNTR